MPNGHPRQRSGLAELGLVFESARALATAFSSERVLDELSRVALRMLPRVDELCLSLWDAPSDQVVDVFTRVGDRPSKLAPDTGHPLALYPATRWILEAASGHNTFRATDRTIPAEVRALYEHWGWRTVLELPLVVEGQSIGLVEFADFSSARAWSTRDVAVGSVVAAHAAVAMRHAQQVEHLSLRAELDGLTGTFNHAAFYERLRAAISHSRRTTEPLGVLLLDLDDFKRTNDTLGHLAGDDILGRTAIALRSACRDRDIVGRIGGDEFGVILPACSEPIENVERRVSGLLQAVAGVSATTGGTTLRPLDDERGLVGRADLRLIARKREKKSSGLAGGP